MHVTEACVSRQDKERFRRIQDQFVLTLPIYRQDLLQAFRVAAGAAALLHCCSFSPGNSTRGDAADEVDSKDKKINE